MALAADPPLGHRTTGAARRRRRHAGAGWCGGLPAVDGIVPKLAAGATTAGLTRVRRSAQDSAPLDTILEARP
ncbi:hypothetical protein [Streptomyces sp. NPDC003863]